MNTKIMRSILLIFVFLAYVEAHALPIKPGGPPTPTHGWDPTPWGDPPSDSHNHNHNENVNLENVLDPSNGMYDAYGSWFDDGSGMKFYYYTRGPGIVDAGKDDPDYIGHGYILKNNPVLYQYQPSFLDYAPAVALGLVNSTFDYWESEINGTKGYRNPTTMLGFSWNRAPIGQTPYINIYWYPQWGNGSYTDTNGNGRWDPGEPFSESYTDSNGNGRYDPGETFADQDGDNLYDSENKGRAWVNPASYPKLKFVEGWYNNGTWTDYFSDFGVTGTFDFYSTAIHEVGHLVGLDDLYNLPGGFPQSIMGDLHVNPDTTKSRTIDTGSIQGGIDLYSIPIPEPSTLLLLGSGLAGIIGFGRKRLFKKA